MYVRVRKTVCIDYVVGQKMIRAFDKDKVCFFVLFASRSETLYRREACGNDNRDVVWDLLCFANGGHKGDRRPGNGTADAVYSFMVEQLRRFIYWTA